MLTTADIEWIRRLPTAPSAQDAATLALMKRRATEPGEIRLVSQLLRDASRIGNVQGRRRTIELRLGQIDRELSTDGQLAAQQAEEFGRKRIEAARTREGLAIGGSSSQRTTGTEE